MTVIDDNFSNLFYALVDEIESFAKELETAVSAVDPALATSSKFLACKNRLDSAISKLKPMTEEHDKSESGEDKTSLRNAIWDEILDLICQGGPIDEARRWLLDVSQLAEQKAETLSECQDYIAGLTGAMDSI